MTIKQLINSGLFETVNAGSDTDREITGVYCCDLLSFAMSKAPEGCAWITVMGNINTLAVAALTDAGCIIMAEGVRLDDTAYQKAVQQQITVLRSEKPEFETALSVYQTL